MGKHCCIVRGGEQSAMLTSLFSLESHRVLGVPEMNSNLRRVDLGVDWSNVGAFLRVVGVVIAIYYHANVFCFYAIDCVNIFLEITGVNWFFLMSI